MHAHLQALPPRPPPNPHPFYPHHHHHHHHNHQTAHCSPDTVADLQRIAAHPSQRMPPAPGAAAGPLDMICSRTCAR